MDLTDLLITNALVIGGLTFALWVVSLPLRNSSIADIFWGAGFVTIAGIAWASAPRSPRSLLVTILVAMWGLRLAAYLSWRNHGQGEDARYQAMRRHHGSRFAWVSLFTVFWLQGLIMWIVALPIQAAPYGDSGLGWLDAVGIGIWSTGCFFEAVGDLQLARFRRNPANQGKVMNRGLWRYTRHPNYFGDFLVWWGLFLIAAASGAWWCIVSPLLMSFLLMRVSGVTLLERSLQQSRPGYQQYVETTSAFFPRPPGRLRERSS